MEQNEYEKIVKAMADKGVPHWVFELLADLRRNEISNRNNFQTLKEISKVIQGRGDSSTKILKCKDILSRT